MTIQHIREQNEILCNEINIKVTIYQISLIYNTNFFQNEVKEDSLTINVMCKFFNYIQ